MATHNKKYRLCRISPGKSLNKEMVTAQLLQQQQTATTKPTLGKGDTRENWVPELPYYVILNVQLKKICKTQKQESMHHTQDKRAVRKNFP